MIDPRWSYGFFSRRPVVMAAALLAACFVLGLVLKSRPAAAQAPDIFEIRQVAVDVTAETAAKARKLALEEGRRKAFRRLLERMTLLVHRERLPSPTPEEIDAFVKDFSVDEEKTSAVRYLANLTFRFNAPPIRQYLIDYGLPFAETFSKPVLILPVLESAGALLLWDDPNPWRTAWSRRPVVNGLVPLVLPLGDLPDIATIGVEQALEGDTQRLTAIAERYNASDSLVVHGILRRDARGLLPELEVYLTRYGTVLQEQTLVRNYQATEGETQAELMLRAAVDLAQVVEDNWKQDNLLRIGNRAVAAVTIPIASLGDWLKVRKRLSGVAVIRRSDLVLLSTDEARVNIHYIGDPDQLSLALQQADLILSRRNGDWILSPRRPKSP